MEDGRQQSLNKLESSLDYEFRDLSYLDRALTHSSYRHEAKTPDVFDNERLEFLGDAVLNFVISNHLYHLFPDMPEGRLAKLKAVMVSEPILSGRGKELQLGKYLLLGKGEQRSGGADRISILGNAFEAVLGALFLDGGIAPVQLFILRELQSDLQAITQESYLLDYKSILQELIQAHFATTPSYQMVQETGPDHDKRFVVRVMINKEEFGVGEGKSKKEAEQQAAQQACDKCKQLIPSFKF